MKIKNFILAAAASAMAILSPSKAEAQFYEITNQLPNLISPALSGSLAYKGFVEAEYLHGLGGYRSDFVGVSTVQGFRYSSWFFMGAGLGVQYVHTSPAEGFDNNRPGYNRNLTNNGVMIPVFTDFRFTFGKPSQIGFFIDLRLGASFLASDNYLQINNGYLSNNEYFYLRPSIGFKVPLGNASSKQAFDIGLSYQLLTSNYWDAWQRNTTVNALGVNVAFEW